MVILIVYDRKHENYILPFYNLFYLDLLCFKYQNKIYKSELEYIPPGGYI